MIAMHPRVIQLALVVCGAIAFDMGDRRRSLQGLQAVKGLEYGKDYEVVSNLVVQSPCPLTPFRGKHVPHRDFTDETGGYVSAFYRFPAHTRTSQVSAWFKENGIRYEPEQCYHSYDCCGNWYCHGWSITARRNSVLVQLSYGRNV